MVKCDIKLIRIFYPKGKTYISEPTNAIFLAKVLKSDDYFAEKINLKGKVSSLNLNDEYTITAELDSSHPEYGDSYRISTFFKKGEDVKSKDISFLSSFTNEETAQLLVKEIPNICEVLENEEIDKLVKVKGIGPLKAVKLIEKYKEVSKYTLAIQALYKYGLSKNLIVKIVDYYSSPKKAVEVVSGNPFVLTEVTGIGFKKADDIAAKLKIDNYEQKRINGFILYTLNANGEKGLSYLTKKDLFNQTKKMLGISEKELDYHLETLEKEKTIMMIGDGTKICLIKYYELENSIFNELLRLHKGFIPNPEISNNIDDLIEQIEKEQGYEYAEKQKKAVILSTKCSVLALTGLAGTGKTATAFGMCKVSGTEKILGVALAGKASVRMAEATGIKPFTIHKALRYSHGKFYYNDKNQLDIDLVLIDESTMINGTLFLALLKAIPTGAKVVMLGDVQQLTPIGNCNVFSDILKANIIPCVRLTEPHRQALEGGIIPFSIQVANQIQIFNTSYKGTKTYGKDNDMKIIVKENKENITDDVIEAFADMYDKEKNILEIQILTPMRLKGSINCFDLNNRIQQIYNPNNNEKTIETVVDFNGKTKKSYVLKIGDKVINTKTNCETINTEGKKTQIYNGNIGIITDIEEGYCIIDFVGIGKVVLNKEQLSFVELAYAISVHKSQGSGFNRIIVALDNSSYILNNVELLYTSITRAKKECILIGTNQAIRHCIKEKENFTKQTLLKDFLIKYQDKFYES